MSNDLGGCRPRPGATVSSPPMGSGVAIAVTAIALVLGFLILHKVNDEGSASISPGGGTGEETETTPLDTSFLNSTTTTIPGDFTSTMVQVANCSVQNGVARMMTSALTDAGFTTVEATNGTCDPKLTTSYVIYNEGTVGAQAVAETVAAQLGGLAVEPGTLPIKVQSGAWAEGSGVVLLLGNELAGKTLAQIQGVADTGTTGPSTTVAGATTTVAT